MNVLEETKNKLLGAWVGLGVIYLSLDWLILCDRTNSLLLWAQFVKYPSGSIHIITGRAGFLHYYGRSILASGRSRKGRL